MWCQLWQDYSWASKTIVICTSKGLLKQDFPVPFSFVTSLEDSTYFWCLCFLNIQQGACGSCCKSQGRCTCLGTPNSLIVLDNWLSISLIRNSVDFCMALWLVLSEHLRSSGSRSSPHTKKIVRIRFGSWTQTCY